MNSFLGSFSPVKLNQNGTVLRKIDIALSQITSSICFSSTPDVCNTFPTESLLKMGSVLTYSSKPDTSLLRSASISLYCSRSSGA